MIWTIGPTSLEGQDQYGQTYYLQGKTNGVFRPLRAIICPYSTQEQLALVHRSGVFYDFTDIYHRIYELNETSRSADGPPFKTTTNGFALLDIPYHLLRRPFWPVISLRHPCLGAIFSISANWRPYRLPIRIVSHSNVILLES